MGGQGRLLSCPGGQGQSGECREVSRRTLRWLLPGWPGRHGLLCSVQLKESCGWRDLAAQGPDHGLCHTWLKYTDD